MHLYFEKKINEKVIFIETSFQCSDPVTLQAKEHTEKSLNVRISDFLVTSENLYSCGASFVRTSHLLDKFPYIEFWFSFA